MAAMIAVSYINITACRKTQGTFGERKRFDLVRAGAWVRDVHIPIGNETASPSAPILILLLASHRQV